MAVPIDTNNVEFQQKLEELRERVEKRLRSSFIFELNTSVHSEYTFQSKTPKYGVKVPVPRVEFGFKPLENYGASGMHRDLADQFIRQYEYTVLENIIKRSKGLKKWTNKTQINQLNKNNDYIVLVSKYVFQEVYQKLGFSYKDFGLSNEKDGSYLHINYDNPFAKTKYHSKQIDFFDFIIARGYLERNDLIDKYPLLLKVGALLLPKSIKFHIREENLNGKAWILPIEISNRSKPVMVSRSDGKSYESYDFVDMTLSILSELEGDINEKILYVPYEDLERPKRIKKATVKKKEGKEVGEDDSD